LINKNNGTFFSKDDEGIAMIMGTLAHASIRNSLYHDDRIAF